MTGWQMLGTVMLPVPFVAVLALIVVDLGWKPALAVAALTAGLGAFIAVASMLRTGALP